MRALLRRLFGTPSPSDQLADWARRDLEANVSAMEDMLPHIQEALDLVERATAELEREQRQAACPHEHVLTLDMRTVADETAATMTWCGDCGYTT